MTTPEEPLRNWDAAIARCVFGWTDIEWVKDHTELMEPARPDFLRGHAPGCDIWQTVPHYSTDAAASDALDDMILANLPIGYSMCYDGKLYWMDRPDQDSTESACHSDKKICRMLFAKELFPAIKLGEQPS